MRKLMTFAVIAMMGAFCVSAQAETLNIDTVVVGNPGNADDVFGTGYGGVDYLYNIATYEVTAGQYTEFLNAVAATDTYDLYHVSMWYSNFGCKIQRHGSSGEYTYSVSEEYTDRPVNYVSYWDACRFTNWLHNGQLSGVQDSTTTEDGAYLLDGYNGADGSGIVRNVGAEWFIPSEDEWYKAAYYKTGSEPQQGPRDELDSSSAYWLYATATDDTPSSALFDPDEGNSANYYIEGYAIGSPYFRSVVGDYENSASPSGTYDQAGNVSEWTEGIKNETQRVYRGGSYSYGASNLEAAYRISSAPTSQLPTRGFRVATTYVPEPGTLMLLALGAFGALRRVDR